MKQHLAQEMKNLTNFGRHIFFQTLLIRPGGSFLCNITMQSDPARTLTSSLLNTRAKVTLPTSDSQSHRKFWDGNYFHQKSSVCFMTALTFAASHTTFYQKILITTKVSFEKHVFHESRNHGKSATQFRLCTLITACNTLPPSAPPCPAGLVLVVLKLFIKTPKFRSRSQIN